MIWATVTIFTPCSLENFSRSGTRAIVPSSFITSHITPAGLKPARRARSSSLRLASPLQHTARSRPKRENVARHLKVLRTRRFIHSNPAGVRPVRRRNSSRDPVPRLYTRGEGRTHTRSVVPGHLRYLQAVYYLPGHRQADETAPVRRHEVYVVGRYKLGRHRQVTLVLPVLIVANNDHLAGFNLFYDLLDRTKRHPPRSSLASVNSCPTTATAAAPRTCRSHRPPGSPGHLS